MNVNDLNALAAVVLAGSLVMERVVTVVKTLFPKYFGEPGPDPEAIYREPARVRHRTWVADRTPRVAVKKTMWLYSDEWRRLRVLVIVLVASLLTAYLLADDTGHVTYGSGQSIYWVMFALLISGGSAFWSQMLGVFGAIKDFRVEQSRQATQTTPVPGVDGAKTVVVYTNDPPRLQSSGPTVSAAAKN